MALGYHSRTYQAQPTTLASMDATSQVNDLNTGTANPRGNVHGATDRFLQRGAEDNQAQTYQAVGGFMQGRKAPLVRDQIDRGVEAQRRIGIRAAQANRRGEAL